MGTNLENQDGFQNYPWGTEGYYQIQKYVKQYQNSQLLNNCAKK